MVVVAERPWRLPVTVRFDPKVVEIASVALGSAWEARQQPVLLHDSGVAIADLKPDEVAPEDNAETYPSRVAEDGRLLQTEIEPHIALNWGGKLLCVLNW